MTDFRESIHSFASSLVLAENVNDGRALLHLEPELIGERCEV